MNPVAVQNIRIYTHLADANNLISAMGNRLVQLIQDGTIAHDDPLFVQWELLIGASCDLTRACTEAL